MITNSRFITFEGGEGAGKSTHIKKLAAYMETIGERVIVTREPGGSSNAEKIRKLIVSQDEEPWPIFSDVFLFAAARVDHWQKIIKPALNKGCWVLCDRYIDSTLSYQGAGEGIDQHFLRLLFETSCPNAYPALTYFLDLSPEKGLQRTLNRENSILEARFEEKNTTFHERVYEHFHKLLQQEPQRFVRIEADQNIDDVFKDILEHWQKWMLNLRNCRHS